jgi:ribosomal protein S8
MESFIETSTPVGISIGAFVDSLKRISKPSLRVYVKSTEMPSIMNGLGIVIVSTPKGVMTGQNAANYECGLTYQPLDQTYS